MVQQWYARSYNIHLTIKLKLAPRKIMKYMAALILLNRLEVPIIFPYAEQRRIDNLGFLERQTSLFDKKVNRLAGGIGLD